MKFYGETRQADLRSYRKERDDAARLERGIRRLLGDTEPYSREWSLLSSAAAEAARRVAEAERKIESVKREMEALRQKAAGFSG